MTNQSVRSEHTFHIPVMGTGFTIDTPLRVAKYGISSIPTVILFHNGEIKEQFVGLRSKADFTAVLDQTVAA